MTLSKLIDWLTDPANWQGPEGVPAQTLLHLYYCVVSVSIACVIAIPLGLYIGHTGRGRVLAVGGTNAMRALPTLGVVTLLVLLFGLGVVPALAGLVILAIPPVLAGTYAGVQNAPADAVDAAKGMGMTPPQRLWQVEVPNALPLIMGGVRNAMLQVVATAAVAAYVNLGGLGRILLDGLTLGGDGYVQMAAAAIFIALLAVALDLALAGVTRLIVSRGLSVGDTQKPVARRSPARNRR